MISMGPNDGKGFCECDNCRALDAGQWDPYAAELSMTDRYVWLFNQILDAVHQKYPGKKLAFYAYHAYKLPPLKYKLNPNIVPVFAPITLCRLHGASNPVCPDRSFYKKLIKEWSELAPEMYERGYYFNLACPGFPFSKIHAVRDETPFFHKMGIKGMRVQCMPAWSSHGPTLYVAARMMWDVNTDVDALLGEYYEKFYGPAAKPMKQYLESMEQAYRDTDCHTSGAACLPKIFPPQWIARGNKLLDKAARKAGKGLYGERVRMNRLAYDYLEAFLEMLEARNRFDFEQAHAAVGRVEQLAVEMLNYKPPLLWNNAVKKYWNRFWVPCTESGYERTVSRGDFVAGTADEWDLLIDPGVVGEELGWERAGPVGGNWRKLRTKTASWSDQGLSYCKGWAWYRTRVSVPGRFKGRKVYLWFGGMDEKSKIWLNGQYLGDGDVGPAPGFSHRAGPDSSWPTHKIWGDRYGGHKKKDIGPLELEATEAVRFGQINTIAVKVHDKGGISGPVMFWSPRSAKNAVIRKDP